MGADSKLKKKGSKVLKINNSKYKFHQRRCLRINSVKLRIEYCVGDAENCFVIAS